MLIGSSRLNHQFVDKAKLATPGMDSFVEKLPAEEISEESAILNASVRISAIITKSFQRGYKYNIFSGFTSAISTLV